MKTRNEFKTYVVLWIIAIVIFNVLVFVFKQEVIGNRYTVDQAQFQSGEIGIKSVLNPVFVNLLLSYFFVILAFIGQLVCTKIFLSQDSLRKTMYHYPLFNISLVGLGLTIVFAIVFCFTNMPPVVSLIIFLATLFYTVFRCLSAKTAANLVSAKEENLELKTQYIKILRGDTESLVNKVSDAKIKKIVQSIADEVRFSDPISVPELIDIEKQMITKFEDLKSAVMDVDYDKAKNASDELSSLIKDRNSRVKALKK